MQPPKIPSFFKGLNSKSFSFKPRYYDERKERMKKSENSKRRNIKFSRNHIKENQKARKIRIVFLIIVLSLLAYKLIIN